MVRVWLHQFAGIYRALAAQVMESGHGYEILSNMMVDRAEAVRASREKRAPRLTGE